ncbi:MAG: hypothetical protein OXH51_03905, partial [Gemmatimonadetes bacterium]|nr:hypothetical protein [Gemmatimonadota bacterium]
RAEILTSIPGISDITAAGLIVHLPELGMLVSHNHADSRVICTTGSRGRPGLLSGRRGERSEPERALNRDGGRIDGLAGRKGAVVSVVAAHHNPDLKRKYEALLAKGKPRKVALTAVMRKLLVLANALVQQDRTWTAQPPRAYSCPAFPTPSPAGSVHG